MLIKLSFLLVASVMLCVDILSAEGQKKTLLRWPGGAGCAVVLTYDDALDQHLDNAAPDLETFGFRGTFFAPGKSESLFNRTDEWRALAARDHELGNHSIFHPCIYDRGIKKSEWLPPYAHLEDYSVDRLIAELEAANTLLKAIDGKIERTYGYTCSDTLAANLSIVEDIEPMFIAARTGDNTVVPEMSTLDAYLVPSWGVVEPEWEELKAFVDKAAELGTMAVFMFHGVGGGHSMNISRENHQRLLAYLAANPDKFYVDTFINTMKLVKAEKARLGWD